MDLCIYILALFFTITRYHSKNEEYNSINDYFFLESGNIY